MVKNGDIVGLVLDDFIQKMKDDDIIHTQIIESLQDILTKKNINETALKEALFGSHKDSHD